MTEWMREAVRGVGHCRGAEEDDDGHNMVFKNVRYG